MGGNSYEEKMRLKKNFDLLPESEKQQIEEDLKKLLRKKENVVCNAYTTIKSLRKAADKLDALWKDCKTAHAYGTSASIAGGIATIATVVTAGMASPLFAIAVGVGAGGAAVNLGTSFVEDSINSTEIKKAEKDLEKTKDSINNVQQTVQSMFDNKDKARLLYCIILAEELHLPILKCNMRMMCRSCTKLTTFAEAKVVVTVGAKKLVLALNAFSLVADALHLGFTIRDIVEEEGSDAAKYLREKADEIEEIIKKLSN